MDETGKPNLRHMYRGGRDIANLGWEINIPQNRKKRKAVELGGFKPIAILAISPRFCEIASVISLRFQLTARILELVQY